MANINIGTTHFQLYNRAMSKKPQTPSSDKHSFSLKKFWLIFFLSITLALIIVSVGTSLYDTYHDRPLAKGLNYIGREYNSGCLPLRILCTSPESEFLYYATDIEPDKVVGLFPGWRVEKVGEENIPIPSYKGSARYYVLRSLDSQRSAGFAYFLNSEAVRSDFKLLPTQKQYTIGFDLVDYEKLHEASD